MTNSRRRGLPRGEVIRKAGGRVLIEIVEYPSSTGHFRAYCDLCSWGSTQQYTERLVRIVGATHLLAQRGNPDHSRKAQASLLDAVKPEETEEVELTAKQLRRRAERLSHCPTPWKQGIYETEEEAREHIRQLYKRGRGNPDYNAYVCNFPDNPEGQRGCGYWHVGHNRKHFSARIKRSIRQSPPRNKNHR